MSEEELLAAGYRKYCGDGVDIYFNASMCQHSGKCVWGNKEIFNTARKPWIEPNNAAVSEVKCVIDTCPSGALKYIIKEADDK